MELPIYDATGRAIVMNNTYGYAMSKSGWSHTVIGKALNITDKGKVTLQVLSTRTFLYGVPSEYVQVTAKKVTISSHMVFPINE